MKVLVTGATGFVGRSLISRLALEKGWLISGAVRRSTDRLPAPAKPIVVGELDGETHWGPAVSGADVVVHLAARVHVMRDDASDPLKEFREVNVEATGNLARQAAAAGTRRFVLLSSIKVHGESGAFAESDAPAPVDPYGISKHEAEVRLREVARDRGMEFVIIRPPLVYGPGVKANFLALMNAVSRRLPLPLGAVDNRRSLVGIDNLVDFVVVCMTHPAAAGEVFLVSDGEDLSTPDLIRRLGRAMGRPARLMPVPSGLLMAAAAVAGRRDKAQRVLGSLQLDISKARHLLGWVPPISVDEGLRRAASGLGQPG
ncbi:MAG: SDR family oxidoreductase [Gemmatimonadota bacterium]|nr:SDR family oxidoreductase [Gemmatimonadota bacterium]